MIEWRPEVVAAWHWFLAATPEDAAALPPLIPDAEIDHPFAGMFCAPTYNQIGGKVMRRSASAQGQRTYARARRLAARRPAFFDEWEVRQGDYREAPDIKATWFIDPPYPGFEAMFDSPELDRDLFWAWVRTRRGFIIIVDGMPPPPKFAHSVWQERGGTTHKPRKSYVTMFQTEKGLAAED